MKDPFTYEKTVDPIQESDFAIGGRKAVKPKPVLPSSNPMDVRISASKGPKRVFILAILRISREASSRLLSIPSHKESLN